MLIFIGLMQFYSSGWIREHTIDTMHSVFCSGISPDQISIAKPGFPRVTYAPLERQTCIAERKAGDRNSSREILSQVHVSVCECVGYINMHTIEVAECISSRGCTIRITWIWIKPTFLFLLVSRDDRKGWKSLLENTLMFRVQKFNNLPPSRCKIYEL